MNESHPETIVAVQALDELSHDSRTPLTSIIGFADLLLDDQNLSAESREYVSIIASEAQRLSKMLDRYIDQLRECLEKN